MFNPNNKAASAALLLIDPFIRPSKSNFKTKKAKKQKQANMNTKDSIKTIWMSAQRFLARREHSRKELLQKLQAKEFPNNEIETVLYELAARGWQDDRKFCEAFIRFRVMKGQGPQKIIHELKTKAVDAAIIAEEMQMYDAQWLQLCENVARKKYGSEKVNSIEDRAKRYRFLSTRGFPSEIVKQVLTLF